MNRNALYRLLFGLCILGYAWLAYGWFNSNFADNSIIICPVQRVAGIPCPSCGTSRSILAILNGRFFDAILLNPLGFVAIAILISIPLWILRDVVIKKDSFYRFYSRLEQLLMRKKLALLFIVLVLCNWLWNLYKFI